MHAHVVIVKMTTTYADGSHEAMLSYTVRSLYKWSMGFPLSNGKFVEVDKRKFAVHCSCIQTR